MHQWLRVNYDEIILHKGVITKLNKKQTVDEQWALFLGYHAPNLLIIVSRMLAIPVSSGFVKRTFCLMKNRWTDTGHRMRVVLVKSELCVQVNSGVTCADVLKFLSPKEQGSSDQQKIYI